MTAVVDSKGKALLPHDNSAHFPALDNHVRTFLHPLLYVWPSGWFASLHEMAGSQRV
jgi:hypothetical protein